LVVPEDDRSVLVGISAIYAPDHSPGNSGRKRVSKTRSPHQDLQKLHSPFTAAWIVHTCIHTTCMCANEVHGALTRSKVPNGRTGIIARLLNPFRSGRNTIQFRDSPPVCWLQRFEGIPLRHIFKNKVNCNNCSSVGDRRWQPP
jgi:hypothetical protein